MHMPIPWILAIVLLLLLAGCNDGPRHPVPAEAEARRLRATEAPATAEVKDLRARELAAKLAAAAATAKQDRAEAVYQQRLGLELATLRVEAERLESEQHAKLEALATAADARAQAERDELDRRATAAQAAADARHARFVGAIGTALAVVLAIVLWRIGVPLRWALLVPGSLAAGVNVLVGYVAAGALIAQVVGGLLVAGVLAGAAAVIVTLARQTHFFAAAAADVGSAERQALDATSRLRQGRWMRWILDHVFHRTAPALPSVPVTPPAVSTPPITG